jgi:hypothetical protein
MSVFLVTGRSVSDFAKCGAVVPPDVAIEDCGRCGDPVTLTRDAKARMETEKRSCAHRLVAALCTPCTLAVARGPGQIAGVEMSPHGAEMIDRGSKIGRAILDELLGRAGK